MVYFFYFILTTLHVTYFPSAYQPCKRALLPQLCKIHVAGLISSFFLLSRTQLETDWPHELMKPAGSSSSPQHPSQDTSFFNNMKPNLDMISFAQNNFVFFHDKHFFMPDLNLCLPVTPSVTWPRSNLWLLVQASEVIQYF
jgi:hypothetical protein